MFRKISVVSAIALLLITLTGCVKLKIDLAVNPDDTVSGSMIVAFKSQTEGLTEPEQFFQAQDGMTVEPYKSGEYVGSKVTFEPKSFKEFSLGSSESNLYFKRVDQKIYVSGQIDLTTNSAYIQDTPFVDALALGDISVSISMPGRISSSTGKVDGDKVTFTGKLGKNLDIDAVSDLSEDYSWVGFTVAAVVLFSLAATAVILRLRKRKK